MRSHKRIIAIPTYNQRIDVLVDTIKSLHQQADIILVVYNGEPTAETFEIDEQFSKVQFLYKSIDFADLSKFDYIHLKPHPEDVIFLCDDDLIYHPNYCDEMEICLALKNTDLISLGGKVIKQGFEDEENPRYATCFSEKIRCFDIAERFIKIDVPLSGVSAFLAGSLPILNIDIKYKYAADVQLYKLCIDNKINAYTYWRNTKMVTYNPKMQARETIWTNHTHPRTADIGQLVQEIYKQTIKTIQ